MSDKTTAMLKRAVENVLLWVRWHKAKDKRHKYPSLDVMMLAEAERLQEEGEYAERFMAVSKKISDGGIDAIKFQDLYELEQLLQEKWDKYHKVKS